MLRWLGAIIGFIFFRVPGALAGFLLGSFIDMLSSGKSPVQIRTSRNISPQDFELNLLSLSAIVIKADGNISPQEMQFVRNYFVQAYGIQHANAVFRTFNEVAKKRVVSAKPICDYIRQRTRYAARLQIIHFLFNIAQADGHVSDPEIAKIDEIAGYLAVGYRDFESIRAMFVKQTGGAYAILEIEPSATDEQVKSAYRTMAKKYHPDKLQHMDEAYRKGAGEKFRRVQEAYEDIQRERGF